VPELGRVRWFDAEPDVLAREREVMSAAAPEMEWRDELAWHHRTLCGWDGVAPAWAGDRAQPHGLEAFLGGRRFKLRVMYREAFPTVPPVLDPLDPVPPIQRRTLHPWHVSGDGSLCMVQTAQDWRPGEDTAADLVRKAAGWFIEYLLMEDEKIDAMTLRGIFEDDSLDQLIGSYVRG
jgi:hypothetical protein